MSYSVADLRKMIAARPGLVDPLLQLALEGAAHREAETAQVLSSYLPVLTSITCRHDHTSKCDEFCGDSGRRARDSLTVLQNCLVAIDVTVAERSAPESELDPNAN